MSRFALARPVAAVAGVLVLGACGSGADSSSPLPGGSTPDANAVPVVAAENFWGDIAAQIGGPHVSVTSIISDPNADPHEYTSSTADATAIAHAKLAVENGLGYDDFMPRLLDASPNAARRVLDLEQDLHITGDDPNPHIWYDVTRVPTVAREIATQLEQIDPADSSYFQEHEATFEQSLDPLRSVIAAIRSAHPGADVAYTERVPGYLLADAGLQVVTPPAFAQAIEAGNDPSAQAVSDMQSVITSHMAKVLLYNSQVTSPITQHIRDLATSSGVPIVGVSETLPEGMTFQAWQLSQAQALQKALG